MRLSFPTPTIGMKWAYAESKKQIVNRIRKPRGCSADRTTGWGGEILDHCAQSDIWHSGGLENDGVGGRGVG